MRSERALVPIVLLIPLAIAFFGWRAFSSWLVSPAPEASAPRPTATSVVEPQATPATLRTTTGVAPTAASPAVATKPTPRAVPTSVAVAEPVEEAFDDPRATVSAFYGLVTQGRYDAAAQLWSPRMQASFPPRANINQRFSTTQSLTIQRADVISLDEASGRAAVAVDVLELGQDGPHNWVGTWYLVRGRNGWLLDQPQLSSQYR